MDEAAPTASDRHSILVSAKLEPEQADYADDIETAVIELQRAGATVEAPDIEFKPRRGGMGILGPVSQVLVQLDAHMIELILIGAQRPLWWVLKTLFKKSLEHAAEKASDASIDALKRLWKKSYARSRSVRERRQHGKLDLSFVFDVDGVPVSISNEVNPDRVENVSDRQVERAFALFIGAVVPSIRKVVRSAKASGSLPEQVEATLVLPVRNLDRLPASDVKWRSRSWHWHIWLGANREYIITPSGRMRWRKSE